MTSASSPRRRGPPALALLLAASLVGTALPPDAALAQSNAAQKETARTLVLSGRAKRTKGDGKGALTDFQGAWAAVKNPTTGYELGKQQAELGLLVEARDTLLEVGRLPKEDKEPAALARAREESKELADDLADKIPSLRIVIVGATSGQPVEVQVDEVAVRSEVLAQPLKLNPGIHSIVVRQGDTQKQSEAMLARGESRELKIDLGRSADKSPVTGQSGGGSAGGDGLPHWLTWVGLGVAVAGGVAGGVTGGIAIAKSNEVAAGCPNGRCPPALHDTLDEGNALAIGSTVAFSVGGAGLALMIVGIFLPTGEVESTGKESATVRPAVGPGFVGLVGEY